MTHIRRRSTCPISSALDLFGDKWTLLVMRDVLFRNKRHYREFLASEEEIATNILADRLARLEQLGLLRKSGEDRRSGKQTYTATDKGKDLIPVLLQTMLWSAKHVQGVSLPSALLAEITKDLNQAARGIGRAGGIAAFLRSKGTQP
jgi:DNA-binding HxlR family transcriptional regulator